MAKQTNGVWVLQRKMRFIEVLVVCLFTLKSTTDANDAEVIFCTCDLNRGSCDVNCCCDPDCSSVDRLAFSSCTNYHNPSTKDTCVQRSIIFIDNSPNVSKTSQPGIFCIAVDNFPLSSTFLNVTVINTTAEFDHYMEQNGKHYFRSQHQALPVKNIDGYKSGDPVLVVHESLARGVLSLPRDLASECVDSNPVSYMIPQKLSCTRPQIDLQQQCTVNRMWSAAAYYKGFRVVRNPQIFSDYYGNFTFNMTHYAYHEDPLDRNIVLDPLYKSTFLTDVQLEEGSICFDTTGEKRTCAEYKNQLPSPSLEDKNHLFVCSDVVSKVKYTIVYNNSYGILNVRVHFILRDITVKDLPLRQTFEVTYVQAPRKSYKLPTVHADHMTSLVSDGSGDVSAPEKPEKYSGNPGYVVGEPLRVGTLKVDVPLKKAAIEMMDDDQHGLTMLTSDLNGDCHSSTHSREPVRFGINMRSGCFVRFNFTNLKETCNPSQWATWIALRGEDPPTHIATFGNSDPHIVGDWVKILEVDAQPRADSAVVDDNRPGTCFNVLSGLDIQIIFAKIGSFENAQAQIIGARFNYFYRNHLQCVGLSCQLSTSAKEQKFEVMSSVTFTDASQPPVGAEAVFRFKGLSVPLHFFYPFGSDDV